MAAAAAALLLLTGCSESVRPADEWFTGPHRHVTPRAHAGEGARGGDDARARKGRPRALPSAPARHRAAGRAGAHLRWGLSEPLSVARAPAHKPALRRTGGLPAVVSRIPVREKTVFLTVDDGVVKDPGFLRLTRDLGLPFTMFLTDEDAGDDYGYFRRLQRLGNPVQNHTLTHPDLRRLGYAAQRREICGQQSRLAAHFGRRPTVFRPPYGAYTADTLKAAASCGIRTVALWGAELKATGVEYDEGGRLHPGDIVLAHFRGPRQQRGRTMTQVVTAMLRTIQRQGYALGRLTDYV